MRKRGTDLLIFMVLAACGGADEPAATAEADRFAGGNLAHGGVDHLPGSVCRRGRGAAPRQRDAARTSRSTARTSASRISTESSCRSCSATAGRPKSYAPIEASTGSRFDDGFGTVDLREGFDPARITPATIPAIRLGQNPGTTEMSAIDPGHAMDLGKTPMAGFSNGTREFGVFNIGKPQGCTKDAECSNGLACDTTLGYFGSPYSQQENGTIGCRDGTPGCTSDTMFDAANKPVPSSGLCIGPDEPAAQRAGVEPAERDRHPGTDRGAR